MIRSDISQLTAVESEVSNYLADPDRCLAMLNKYPTLRAAFTKFNSLFSVSAGTNLDGQKKPAIRQQLGKTCC